MELIEREALKKRVKQSTVSNPIKAAMQVFIDTAPTIDAIRAAGGCRCGECKYYGKRCTGLVKLDTGVFWSVGGCLQGEPREAQDDE